jgi:myo-inositol-1(or 4)-monophosphatase
MGRFGRVSPSHKADGSLLTEADTAMQAAIVEALNRRFRDIPVLAEEQAPEFQQRMIAEAEHGVWCLDPLDGTTNFASGMPLFGVSLALIRRGVVELGLVHDPVRGETFTARRGAGAHLNGRALRTGAVVAELAECVAVVDFKRLSAPLATRLAVAPPFRSQRSIGSVALDWSWLAAGRFQLYLHGGQRLWDYAAGQLIAREAGAAVCLAGDINGDCGFEPSLEPRVATGAADAELLAPWRAWLAEAC